MRTIMLFTGYGIAVGILLMATLTIALVAYDHVPPFRSLLNRYWRWEFRTVRNYQRQRYQRRLARASIGDDDEEYYGFSFFLNLFLQKHGRLIAEVVFTYCALQVLRACVS